MTQLKNDLVFLEVWAEQKGMPIPQVNYMAKKYQVSLFHQNINGIYYSCASCSQLEDAFRKRVVCNIQTYIKKVKNAKIMAKKNMKNSSKWTPSLAMKKVDKQTSLPLDTSSQAKKRRMSPVEKLHLEIQNRGHTFKALSDPHDLKKSALTAVCANGHEFTIPVNHYRLGHKEEANGRKNGCPICRKEKQVQFWHESSLVRLKQEIKNRNHTFISVSHPKNAHIGTLTAICAKGHQFTINVKSYRIGQQAKEDGLKNGCPFCRKTKLNFKNKETAYISAGPGLYSRQFSNEKEFFSFLKREKNSYSNFILKKLSSSQSTGHLHHIQPKHAGGSEASWNRIYLSVEDHAKAHELLYQNYGNYFDLCAACMLRNKKKEGLTALWKQNQENMKCRKVGFFNSELQRELAKRPRKKRCFYARSFFVKKALEKGFMLESIKTKAILEIKPGEFSSICEVMEKWMTHPEMAQIKKTWEKLIKKESFYYYTALLRTLDGPKPDAFTENPKTKKQKILFSFAGWRILGIFL